MCCFLINVHAVVGSQYVLHVAVMLCSDAVLRISCCLVMMLCVMRTYACSVRVLPLAALGDFHLGVLTMILISTVSLFVRS